MREGGANEGTGEGGLQKVGRVKAGSREKEQSRRCGRRMKKGEALRPSPSPKAKVVASAFYSNHRDGRGAGPGGGLVGSWSE